MSEIKEVFTSRYHNGNIIEMDFSQLEVIGLAVLSKDPVLKNDLLSGIDMHCQNCVDLFPEMRMSYDDWVSAYKAGDMVVTKKRKVAKAFSFQLQYGAGAPSMAADQGVPEHLAKKFIDNYYARYPRVKTWQDENIELVNSTAEISSRRTEMGYPAMVGYLLSPTGRTYEFTQFDAPEFMKKKGIDTSFSPTQIKNYPVQGFSTGDIVPMALGKVMRYLAREGLLDTILMINTIHDSILFDVPDAQYFGNRGQTLRGNLIEHVRNLQQVLMSITTDINLLWPAIDFDIPLAVDVEYGSDWGNMQSFDNFVA